MSIREPTLDLKANSPVRVQTIDRALTILETLSNYDTLSLMQISEKGGIYEAGSDVAQAITEELESRGYKVTLNDGSTRVKGKTLDYRNEVDLALEIAGVIGYGAQNNYRIQWKTAMSNEVPWFVYEVPTVFASLNFTTHLHDATMVKTYINTYHDNDENIKQLIDKLEGKSEFKGTLNENVWANKWQAKL
ncbi:Beta-hexosaminidase [Carnobacterium antarcticum]|nr:Beta-hexosaminidase [Carnobacterium sp. CP1]